MSDFMYPTPAFTSFMDLFTFANAATGNLFGYGVILSVFAITFLSLKSYETEKAFTAAGTITATLAILMNIAGIIPFDAVMPAIFVALIGVAYMAATRK